MSNNRSGTGIGMYHLYLYRAGYIISFQIRVLNVIYVIYHFILVHSTIVGESNRKEKLSKESRATATAGNAYLLWPEFAIHWFPPPKKTLDPSNHDI